MIQNVIHLDKKQYQSKNRMSLLSNLLTYSSLNQCGQKQQRSSSASSKFLFDLDDNDKVVELKQRVVSKSSSKMGLLSNTSLNKSKIDPKYRCLHRIIHNLNMKVRKQYYGFFVTLETISKNNKIKQNQKKPKLSLQKIQNAIIKISQTFSIRYLKQYQNSYKEQSFKKIKQFGSKANLIKIIDKINVNNNYKFYCMKLFRYFNELDKLKMKFQLVQSAIQPVLKKFNNMQILDGFQNIKFVAKQQKQMKIVQQMAVKQKYEKKSISIFEMFQNIERKASQKNYNKLQINQNKQKYKIQQDLFISQKSNIIVQHNLQQHQQLEKYESINHFINNQRSSVNINFNNFQQSLGIYKNKFHSLPASLWKNSQNRNKPPFATSKKILNLRQSVQKDRLELKFYQKIYKSYQIATKYQQKPFQLISQYESMPKMIHKMTPQQFGFEEVSDLADKSNIFRDFQSSKVSYIDNLQISNVVEEPFMRADTLLSQIQRNRDRYQSNSISQLSYTSYLNHQSTLSIINKKQQSNFGCDAVNFKNSLVMQRESMKKTQRQKVDMFIKKKTLINSEDLVDHQSQQLKNLRNRKKNHKQLSQRKTIQEIMSTNYKNNYQFQPEYLIKNQTNYQSNRVNNLTLQPNYNNICNWQNKKPYHQYNSEGKNKSLSFNSKADELVPRRLRFDGTDFEKKFNDDSFVPNFYSTSNTFRENFSWKTDLIENRMQLPVKDVGLDPISKIRAKNNNTLQSQPQRNKETPTINKKFINISKR